MRYRAGSVVRLAAPLKVLVQRFAFLLLVASAFALMMLGKGDALIVERFRAGVVDLVAPAMEVLSRPAATVAAVVDETEELIALRTENARLREEIGDLREWQNAARRIGAENASLRDLLSFVPSEPARFISARVIGDTGGAFVRSMILNAGRRHGVEKGQAVVTGDGFAGRIFEAGFHSARVLLVTDINSRIPVLVESSRARAILAGDNSDRPRLAFLAANAEVAVGDRIVTSGHGGMFPMGLPVGTVAQVRDGVVRVAPLVDLDRLEFVRVVDYGRVLPPDATGPDAAAGAAPRR